MTEASPPTTTLIETAASQRNQKHRFHSDLNASIENAIRSQDSMDEQKNPVVDVASIQEERALGQGGIYKHLSDMMLEQ